MIFAKSAFRPALSAAFTAVLVVAPPALAQTTEWTGSFSNWGTASNWSNGEPTADVDAVVPFNGTPTVTLAGETCRSLTTATGAAGSTLRIEAGSLSVVGRLLLGAAFSASGVQLAGAVSAAEFAVGSTTTSAAWTMSGGTLDAGIVRIGPGEEFTSGTFTLTAGLPRCTIADSLVIGPAGSFVCGAGTLTVGTSAGDGVLVGGAFTLSNQPAVSLSGWRMTGESALSVFIGPTGVSTIQVTGTAVLDGQILVTEVLAPNGTWEVLRGNPLQGTFDAATLPNDWSWRIEGNSLLLTKGPVPVDPASWGGIKSRFGR